MSLPNEYIELEYIQSSGTQCIDTGVIIDNQYKIELDVYQESATQYQGICGIALADNTGFMAFLQPNTSNQLVNFQDNANPFSANLPYVYGQRNQVSLEITTNQVIFKVNGQTNTRAYSRRYLGYSIFLFGANRYGSLVGGNANMRLYACKQYLDGVLVRDFIPSIRKTDLTIGLYDLANNEFYTNSGSGVFTGKFKENPQPSSKPFDIVFFYPNGTIQYDVDKSWDYNEKKLFDTWEMLSNVQIVKQDEDTNVVAIYNQDGTTLRGAYTILNDGTIQQITDGVAIPNRVGSNKTKYVFDSNNNVLDLAKANLPNLQYNHKITFNINFDGEYKFEDFNLAQPIKFYSTKDNTLFNSILTGRKYEISQNSDVIQNATFTLGKVRTDLTSKLNKVR